jgi:two-component system, LytTR family, sensor kinase
MNTRLTYRFRFIVVPLIGLFFNFVTYFTTPAAVIAASRAEYGWLVNDVLGAIITIIDALLLSEGCLLIYHWLDKKLPWEHNPAKRLWVQGAAHTAYALVATALVYYLFGTCILSMLGKSWDLALKDVEGYEFLFYQTLFEATIISLLIVAVYTGLMLFGRWQAATLEAEESKRAQLLAELEALRAQLDPHFLFNNLNTLTALIEDEPPAAVRFVVELSEVYRYVLQARERELVSLAEEVEFVRAFVFLATMRFGENLIVQIDIPQNADEYSLPPMSLQLLVENAMKHNVISRERPLHIRIYAEHYPSISDAETPWIVVANILQRRSSTGVQASKQASKQASNSHSTGIGLPNLARRYAMLTAMQPIVLQASKASIDEASEFVVKLPLLLNNAVKNAVHDDEHDDVHDDEHDEL